VSTDVKLGLIERLIAAGVMDIEAAAFVSPKWVPQMADAAAIFQRLEQLRKFAASSDMHNRPNLHEQQDTHEQYVWPHQRPPRFSALVPNIQGAETAISAGCTEIAVFAAASESFSQNNIHCSIDQSIDRFVPVIAAARAAGVRVRGYVSCALGCPFEGTVAPERVAEVAQRLLELGCYEISLGDTIGRGTPSQTLAMLDACLNDIAVENLAGHFHDTWGMAIANIVAAMQLGVATFDSSVAGIGGCPYSPGASGNVATEDVVYLCNEMGIETGIDLAKLIAAGDFISAEIGRSNLSRAAQAWHAQGRRQA
jgi:hydroxymethylglutaryl-CoA lyase